jgi:hypothetical protein
MTKAHAHRANATKALRLSLAMAAVGAALMIAPAAGQATTTFGSNVGPDVQPSNANEPHTCEETTGTPGACTWVENEAYTNGDPNVQTRSPKTGTIKRISWIAGAPGSFRFQVVKVKADGSAKATFESKQIAYQGQAADEEPYEVESAKVKAPVKKGQYLAIEASETSMLRCSSGGPNTLLYQPALQPGNPFQAQTADDGCWLLLQAKVK